MTIPPFRAGDRADPVGAWRAAGLVRPADDPERGIERMQAVDPGRRLAHDDRPT
ncbi:MAG: hypothetical protein ACLGIJ_14050 [Candidatus Limnocylindria bacterium]